MHVWIPLSRDKCKPVPNHWRSQNSSIVMSVCIPRVHSDEHICSAACVPHKTNSSSTYLCRSYLSQGMSLHSPSSAWQIASHLTGLGRYPGTAVALSQPLRAWSSARAMSLASQGPFLVAHTASCTMPLFLAAFIFIMLPFKLVQWTWACALHAACSAADCTRALVRTHPKCLSFCNLELWTLKARTSKGLRCL